jgi:hypothetical protein
MEPCDAEWRGLGVIPMSGMKLRPEYAAFDARKRIRNAEDHRPGSNPACRCGEVLQGKCRPVTAAVRQGLHAGASGGRVHGFQRGRLLGVLSIRRKRIMVKDKTVTLAHGAGGTQTAELIDQVFKAHFSNPDFTADDAAVLPWRRADWPSPPTASSSPLGIPGGNIGKLSICGTVNDLSCMGAKPLYLSCAFVIEEGFPMDKLEEIAAAMEKTAKEAGVRIVAGDTKVAGRGQVDTCLSPPPASAGMLDGVHTSGALARPGDAVIVTGDVGRHGCAILLARDEFGIDADVTSDCAPLWGTGGEDAGRHRPHPCHPGRHPGRRGHGAV